MPNNSSHLWQLLLVLTNLYSIHVTAPKVSFRYVVPHTSRRLLKELDLFIKSSCVYVL